MEIGFGFGTVVAIILVIYVLSSIKILAEYERGVIFRLGRLLSSAKGPGVILVFTPIDRIVRVSLRQEALEVPPQDIITRDNVTLKVNAVIFLRVIDPSKAVVEVSNYVYQTSQFAQTTLRSVLGEQELDELLAHREKINLRLQSILDQHTSPWGVKVTNVEVKQVDMPESMLRAMAKQAEAEREKRSKIIHAEGEFSAAQRPASLFTNSDRDRSGKKHDCGLPGSRRLLFWTSETSRKARGSTGEDLNEKALAVYLE
jgi:regulator of protease activity HflC (stomatin/prohibitin superfamily)